MSFPYRAQGKPIPFEGKGDFLKFDPETGGIVRTEAPPPDTSPRVVKLKTFNPEGDENEIFAETKFSRGPNNPGWTLQVTRKIFFEIVELVLANEALVRKIILEWKRQNIHYLSGAMEPLKDEGLNIELYNHLGGSEDKKKYTTILSMLRGEITAQIVDLKATTDDYDGLEPVEREYILPMKGNI